MLIGSRVAMSKLKSDLHIRAYVIVLVQLS